MQAELSMVQWMTDFGDQSVVLPVSCVVLLFLCLSGWRRGAALWLATIVGTLGTMLLLKLGFGACGWEFGTRCLDSPSGHTASATVLYGNLMSILWQRARVPAALVATCLIAAAFAASRLILHDHTIPEVLLGAGIGIGAALAFWLLVGPVPRALHRGWMTAAILLIIGVMHGNRMPAERQVHSFATVELRARFCPGP